MVDHLHNGHHATPFFANQVRPRPAKFNLARSVGSVPQLRFQSLQVKGIAGPIRRPTRQQETREPPRRLCQYREPQKWAKAREVALWETWPTTFLLPTCIGFIGGTAETSNIGYGALGANPRTLFSQAFGVVPDSAQTRQAKPNARKLTAPSAK
jgi:hypothetical protein